MDSAWQQGIYLGQRTVSGEFLVGTKEGVFRPRTVARLPVEKRWQENLSFVTGLPWKHNLKHEVGEEVMLDPEPPVPSDKPVTTQLPPRVQEEPSKDLRGFYVKTTDLDPAVQGGIRFTAGCKGCKAIMFGGKTVGHEAHCRHRVVKTASTNPSVAARVRVAVDRDVKWHAEKLEAEETKRKDPEVRADGTSVDHSDDTIERLSKRRKADQESDEGVVPNQVGVFSARLEVPVGFSLRVCRPEPPSQVPHRRPPVVPRLWIAALARSLCGREPKRGRQTMWTRTTSHLVRSVG